MSERSAAPAVSRGDVARGAGLAGLARAGALIEAIAQPLFIWLYGLATYGLYVALWGAVNLVSNVVDLSMTGALQRVVPGESDEERVHGAVKAALLVAVLPSVLVAAFVTWQADSIAGLFSAAAEDRDALPFLIAFFVWALPLWTFVEVATSAARARRAFGPEIRLRILWEQLARIGFAVLFFFAGMGSIGLAAAHMASLALTVLLCLPLLARYYDLKRVARAPAAPVVKGLVATGLALLPAAVARRLLVDAPPVVLNLALPGAQGAVAAGLFEIARKIATVPLIVRQAFQYVMAPLAAEQARADRTEIGPLYRFACRVSTAMVVPLAGLLIFAGRDILSVYRPEAMAALPLLIILVAARAAEAVAGPATPIGEMTGHRALPRVNSLLAAVIWGVLALLLVPREGALGMAIATAAATLAATFAATLELRIADRLSPFDRSLFAGLAIALAGVGAMALAAEAASGPARFAAVLLIWAATSWTALRFGLAAADRAALGGFARRLRLA